MASADEQIGRNVTKLRGDMSQKDLADKMRDRGWKWSQATVWSVEKGDRPLRLAEAADLAGILSVSTFELTLADGFTQTKAAMRQTSSAHDALKQAVALYKESQLQLAFTADKAEVFGTGYQDMVESWLTMSPADVVRAAERDEEAEDLKDRFLSGDDISGEVDEELRSTRLANNGPFVSLLSEEWSGNGEHKEEA